MKTTAKLKLWGVTLAILGVTLIVLSTTIYSDSFGPFSNQPNKRLLIPGVLCVFFSFPLLVMGFSPQLTRLSAKVQTETVDHAKDDLNESVSKTTDVMMKAVTPSIKTAINELGTTNQISLEEQLKEAKRLFDQALITNEEYQALRNKILGI